MAKQRVGRYDAKIGSIPVTTEVRKDVETISTETGMTYDDILRKGLRMVIRKYQRVTGVEMSSQKDG